MNGDEAERWGFYNRVCSPEMLQPDAWDLASTLANGPTAAHAVTKRCLHNEWAMEIDDALDYEAKMQAECMTHNDFERAYVAFVEKKTPQFEGN
jgi:enoyl-CoA hydratase/carnithine racemase